MKKFILFSLVLFSITFYSCEKEEEKTSLELLQKKWVINMITLGGQFSFPEDGSYLKFNEGNTGEDYKGENKTTGSFTYTLSEEGTQLDIVDNDPNGGSYKGKWSVDLLLEEHLRISMDTGIFGIMELSFDAAE